MKWEAKQHKINIMKKLNDTWRMMGLVPYNISEIQKGIQFGHAVQEYGNFVRRNPDLQVSKDFIEWSEECKTFIILNGGTTNNTYLPNETYVGSLNNHTKTLHDMNVNYAVFNEPDLGDQLTATVFLVHEKVYNKTKYPNFWDWDKAVAFVKRTNKESELVAIKFGDMDSVSDEMTDMFNHWIENEIGEENFKLRQFLQNFKLA